MKRGRYYSPQKHKQKFEPFHKRSLSKKKTKKPTNNSVSSITEKPNLKLKKKKPTLVPANTEVSLYWRVIQASGFCSFNRHTTNAKSLR